MASTDYVGKYKKLFPGMLSSNSFLTVYILHLLDHTTHMYGKEIVDQISERLNGVWQPSHGLVYPLLHKLEELEMIEGKWEGTGKKKTRRFYSITPKGSKALLNETKRIKPMFELSKQMIEDAMEDLYQQSV